MKDMKITTSPAGGGFQKGGNNPMFGWRGSGEQEPGQSSQAGTGGKRDYKPKAGGTGVASSDESKRGKEMSATPAQNRYGAGEQEPGQSASAGKRQDGFAHGGDTPMWGNRGSLVARPGQSSQ